MLRLHPETPPPMSSLWSPIQMSNEWKEEQVLTDQMLDELIEEQVLNNQDLPASSSPLISTTSPTTTPKTMPSSKKGKEPEDPHRRGPHEMHHGMKALMTETSRALAHYQWEFHLLVKARVLVELQVPRDFEQERQLNSQAMEKLNQYQFYQKLHLRQYQLVDRFPAPWEDLPLRNTISADNPGMNIATYLDDWLVPVSRSGRLPSKPTRTQPPGMPIMTGDPEPSSSTLTSSPNMSTESSFQLSSSEENWETSNQAEPTLSELSLGTYHVPENIPRLYQIQEGFRVRSWSALHRDNERFLQRIAIPRLPPLTGYEVFPYPKEIPTRRNRPSIEEMREGGVGETRQPSDAEQLLAGVFDTGLDRLLLVLDFARRNSSWTRSELDAWDALDDPGNYDDADPYYRPDEGGGDYQGPFDY
ncbi:hypothetical protein HETIRDRAFT_108308 [Heterobasidion irregulare TC 32-1]|uniref:Uncharacterized protein n=1 Tax=Heterobasidion irregulare (strain TC 32-1) TaxID=747525 RepID=W4JNC6_HETIT|nr:uncharacterized protein HETIRDRAFT_108308 [Heterobasidion irregulare TC 32-1]ETW75043.1 hypothetical protein HETIRDRAFT_108308 [Heterobasidion irregulare TC 32-1]